MRCALSTSPQPVYPLDLLVTSDRRRRLLQQYVFASTNLAPEACVFARRTSIVKVLRYVEAFLFDAPVVRLVAVLFAIMLFRTGIWCIPNLEEARAIAVNPFVNPIADPYTQVPVTGAG